MVQQTETDSDDQFMCTVSDLISRLNYINKQGKVVILLIDELNKMGVPLDAATSSFLTKNFLDKKGRYLIFSSHIQFHIDDPTSSAPSASKVLISPSGRTMMTLPLPFCTDRTVLENMLGGSIVTDLKITLSVGIPSLVYIMSRPSRIEMSFQERFDDVVSQFLKARRGSGVEKRFITQNRHSLLPDFLTTVIHGTRTGGFFEVFSTPVSGTNLLRFPLPYIPIILQFLRENEAMGLYETLVEASAQSTELGRDWELLITFSIYLRSLEAKYCKTAADGKQLEGPFGIATDGVDDVRVITIRSTKKTVDQAVAFIKEESMKRKTICIFQLAYARFPDFDGFVSYRGALVPPGAAPTIHGYQCKLIRGYPRHPVDTAKIAKGLFLRGGKACQTPVPGWESPPLPDIDSNLLGFGLRLLHPLNWDNFPDNDGFD